jgi:hypothetical protein
MVKNNMVVSKPSVFAPKLPENSNFFLQELFKKNIVYQLKSRTFTPASKKYGRSNRFTRENVKKGYGIYRYVYIPYLILPFSLAN